MGRTFLLFLHSEFENSSRSVCCCLIVLFHLHIKTWVEFRVLFSSVGRARVPCAVALQRTRVWLPAWVLLLRVTPALSLLVSWHIFSCSINKAIKGPKKYFKKVVEFRKNIINIIYVWMRWIINSKMWQRETLRCKHEMCVEWFNNRRVISSSCFSHDGPSSLCLLLQCFNEELSPGDHTKAVDRNTHYSLVFKYVECFALSTSSLSPSSGWQLHYKWSRSNSNRRGYQRLKHLSSTSCLPDLLKFLNLTSCGVFRLYWRLWYQAMKFKLKCVDI